MRPNKQTIIFTEDRDPLHAGAVLFQASITATVQSSVVSAAERWIGGRGRPMGAAGEREHVAHLDADAIRERLTARLQTGIYGEAHAAIMRARMLALGFIPAETRSARAAEFRSLVDAFRDALDACAFTDEPLAGLQKTAGRHLKEGDR